MVMIIIASMLTFAATTAMDMNIMTVMIMFAIIAMAAVTTASCYR